MSCKAEIQENLNGLLKMKADPKFNQLSDSMKIGVDMKIQYCETMLRYYEKMGR